MTALSGRAADSKLSSRACLRRQAKRGICFFSNCGAALCVLFLLASLFPRASTATIRYELSLAKPSEHLFHVTMTIPNVHGELVLQMPAWNALYQIRDFASRIQEVSAASDSKPVAIEKIDKQTWRVQANGTVTVKYAIFWDSPGPFASQLNEEHAFINPAMVLMYSPVRRKEDIVFLLRDLPAAWRQAATSLTAAPDGYIAENFDALADSPIEIGIFKRFRVEGLETAITVAVHGDNWKQSEVEATLRKICSYELQLMGGAPFDEYLFILHIGKGAAGAGGGMEHANSTAISVASDKQLAGVAAHEFFHLWNVKRVRPASLEPVDYTREQYTRALWFAEGVTSTYGRYTQLRSGLWSKQEFYDDLGQQITELESRPANRWQSAEQSSLDAWLEKYPYYNGSDFSISYYTKGQVLGVLLDILIRDRTNEARSLDDVMRKMNDDFARQGKTYRDSLDVRLTAESVAGGSFEDFFRRYVAAAEPLPYTEVLSKAGLLLRRQEQPRADLGFAIERDAAGRPVVRSVSAGSAAERAGLRPGEEVESWDGETVPRRTEAWLRSHKPGDVLRLRLRRAGQSLDLSFELGGGSESVVVIDEDSHASPKAKAIRDGLLRGTTAKTATAQ